MLKAICTWGDGPDVLLANEDDRYLLLDDPGELDRWTHGTSRKGQLDLTVAEARALAADLMLAAKQAEDLDEAYRDACSPKEVSDGG